MGGIWVNDSYGWRFNMSQLNKVSDYLNSTVIIDDDDDDTMFENVQQNHHPKRRRRRSGLHRECSFEIEFFDDDAQ